LGIALFDMLENMLERHPEEFHALVAIAHDRGSEVPKKMISYLRHCLMLRKDGSLPGDVRDIILSSYQADPGPMLINPFRLDSIDTVQAIEEQRENNYRHLAKWLRDDSEPKQR
jgi:hypothetical protein